MERSLKKLANAVKLLIAVDREEHLENKAAEAQVASHNNDTRSCFAIVKCLAATKPQPHKTVQLLDGRMSANEEERQARWQQHFAKVFMGQIITRGELAPCTPSLAVAETILKITPHSTAERIKKSKEHKATGMDEIPSELMKAGGDAFAIKLSELGDKVARSETWPINWQ
eukprot:11456600-Karenia_brevis.AAC.1